MNNKRLLFLSMVALTLSIGVIIGTIVSGGVKATFQEKPAAIVIPDPVSLSNAFSQIAAQLEPSVVSISVEIRSQRTDVQQRRRVVPQIPGLPPDFFDFGIPEAPPGPQGGSGTGFIVDKAGYILTNHHVIDGATKITVELGDDSRHIATVVGSDEATDIGVIKIDAGRELPAVKFGNSEAVKTGDWVLAIGSPFGFEHTVTSGIVSAKGRENSRFGVAENFRGLQRFIQTDAAINPGNSGGPLVNMAGEVIGVNTAIVSETASFAGLGFALPSNTAVDVYNQLSQHGKVTRGSIGIQYESQSDPTALEAWGLEGPEAVVVTQVYQGSPAARAGLRPYDVITEVDGTKIRTGNQLQDYIVKKPVGSSIRLGFLRDGRTQTANVTVGDRESVLSDAPVAANVPDRSEAPRGGGAQSQIGIQVEPVADTLRRQFSLNGGVLITRVDGNTPADDAGLEEEMIVTGIVTGGRFTPITNIADFRRVEGTLKAGMSVVLRVRTPLNNYQQDLSIPLKLR